MYDFRAEDNHEINSPVPNDLFDEYRSFIQTGFDSKFPQGAAPSLKPPLTADAIEFMDLTNYSTALRRLKNQGRPVDLRAMLSKTGDATVPEYGSVHFNNFMTGKGFDGIVYVEGGEDFRHFNNPASYVFFNLNKIGTFKTWHQQAA